MRFGLVLASLVACGTPDPDPAVSGLEVQFVLPVNGAAFDPLLPVSVCVQLLGDDGEAELTLSSDVDGVRALPDDFAPCEGGDLGTTIRLSDAPHTLQVSASDAGEGLATASVTVVPLANEAPSCVLRLEPEGDLVVFSAEVTDDAPPARAFTSLASDRDGVVWSGAPSREGSLSDTLALSEGVHLLTLTVEDARGARGTCTATLESAGCTDCDTAEPLEGDADGDGFIDLTLGGDDCDDGDATVYPSASELLDARDNDCDGRCDEGLIREGDLFVSELLVNPNAVSDELGEWVELYNPTGQDIALCEGWMLYDDGADAASLSGRGLIVPSRGYAVVCLNDDPATNGGVVCDASYSGMSLGNGGDEVRLSFDGVEIDSITYNSGFDTIGAAQALGTPFTGTGNDATQSWCDATTPMPGGDLGTPGAPNDCP